MTKAPSWLPPLFLGLAVSLCYLPDLVGGRIPFFEDIAYQNLPFRVAWARAVHEGRWPFWEEGVALGYPLHAEGQTAGLFPLTWLYLLLPPGAAWNLAAVLTAYLTALGFYVLGRRLGLSPWAATVSGLAGALNGYAISQQSHVNFLQVMMLWPWLLACLQGAVSTGGPLWFVAISLLVAFQGLAGHGQAWMLSLLTASLWCRLLASNKWQSEGIKGWRERGKVLAPPLAAMFYGLWIAAPQWLCTSWLVKESPRGGNLPLGEAGHMSYPPWHLLTWFFPRFFGHESPGVAGDYWSIGTATEFQGWCGLTALWLAGLWWLHRKPKGTERFFGWLAFGALLFALGGYTPLPMLWTHMPPLAWFRAPARALGLVVGALAILAGFGADVLGVKVRERGWGAGLRSLAGFLLIPAGAAGVAWIISGPLRSLSTQAGSWLMRKLAEQPFSPPEVATLFRDASPLQAAFHIESALTRTAETALPALLITVAAIVVLGIGTTLIEKGWRPHAGAGWAWTGPVLALAITVELASQAIGFHPTTPASECFSMPATARFLKAGKARAYSLWYPPEPTLAEQKEHVYADMSLLWNVPEFFAYTPLRTKRHEQVLEVLDRKYVTAGGLVPGALRHVGLLRGLGVGYVLTASGEEAEGMRRVYDNGRVAVWRVPRPLTEGWTVEFPAGDKELLRSITVPDWNPEENTNVEGGSPPGRRAQMVKGACRLVERRPGLWKWETYTGKRSCVVFPSLWLSEGWTAEVDGKGVWVGPANTLLAAIPIPPGNHTVMARFQDPKWRASWWVAGFGLLLVLGDLHIHRKEQKKRVAKG